MGIKIPKSSRDMGLGGQDGVILHIKLMDIDRYAILFHPLVVKGRKIIPSIDHMFSDNCLGIETDGETLAKILLGEQIEVK